MELDWIKFTEAVEQFNLTPSALQQLVVAKFVRSYGAKRLIDRLVSVKDLQEIAEKVPELFEAAKENRSVVGRDPMALRSRLLRLAAEKRGLLPLSSQAKKFGLTVHALRVAAKRHKVNLVRVGGRLYVVPDDRWKAFVEARSLQKRTSAPKLDLDLLARLKFTTTEGENGGVESERMGDD